MLKFKAVGEKKKERKKREKKEKEKQQRQLQQQYWWGGGGGGGAGRGKNHDVMTISEMLLQNPAVFQGTAQGGLCLPS